MPLSSRPSACVLLAVLLAGCAAKPVATAPVKKDLPADFVASHLAVLRCPELAPVGLQLNDTALRLDLPAAPRDLPQAEAASGALYEADGFRLWLKGDGALYQQPGEETARECRVYTAKDPWESARLRDVSFRAVGTEPGWLLEVVPDKWLLLLANYGQDRVIAPAATIERDGDVTRLRAQVDETTLAVTVTPLTCSDGMSDEVYDQQVAVDYNGVVFTGCGRWLAQ